MTNEWTTRELNIARQLKAKGYTSTQIAGFLDGRSSSAVRHVLRADDKGKLSVEPESHRTCKDERKNADMMEKGSAKYIAAMQAFLG